MIRIGDCLALAKELPDNSVDCIVTSPPYWGLRDYGNPDAWGEVDVPYNRFGPSRSFNASWDDKRLIVVEEE